MKLTLLFRGLFPPHQPSREMLMVAKVFKDKEAEYLHWIHRNPAGYVLTTVRNVAPNYMSLHRASCRMISKYMSNMRDGAFTAHAYIKVCARHTEEIESWIKACGSKQIKA